jgi:hypothetical protein
MIAAVGNATGTRRQWRDDPVPTRDDGVASFGRLCRRYVARITGKPGHGEARP